MDNHSHIRLNLNESIYEPAQSFSNVKTHDIIAQESQLILARRLKLLGLSVEENKCLKPTGVLQSKISARDLQTSINRLNNPKHQKKLKPGRQKPLKNKIKKSNRKQRVSNLDQEIAQTARSTDIITDRSTLPTDRSARLFSQSIISEQIHTSKPTAKSGSINLTEFESSELGDMFMVMSKRKTITPKTNQTKSPSLKSLNQKIVKIAMQSPSDLYRILSSTPSTSKQKQEYE